MHEDLLGNGFILTQVEWLGNVWEGQGQGGYQSLFQGLEGPLLSLSSVQRLHTPSASTEGFGYHNKTIILRQKYPAASRNSCICVFFNLFVCLSVFDKGSGCA